MDFPSPCPLLIVSSLLVQRLCVHPFLSSISLTSGNLILAVCDKNLSHFMCCKTKTDNYEKVGNVKHNTTNDFSYSYHNLLHLSVLELHLIRRFLMNTLCGLQMVRVGFLIRRLFVSMERFNIMMSRSYICMYMWVHVISWN